MENLSHNDSVFAKYNLPERAYFEREEEVDSLASKAEGMNKGQLEERIASRQKLLNDFEKEVKGLEGNNEKFMQKKSLEENINYLSDELDILNQCLHKQ